MSGMVYQLRPAYKLKQPRCRHGYLQRKEHGFSIGVNEAPAAGQTIAHAHIHIIPRYSGDRPDPRGGIRWISPDKARYW